MSSREDIFPIAEALAADLAGVSVDPNEAQKALAYLRSKRSGRALFDYLQAIVNNGQVVIRSRQTLDYYRNLQVICQRHLRPLQDNYEDMMAAFAWGLRLLRYYRAVPQAVVSRAEQHSPAQAVSPEPRPNQPPVPQIPGVGAIFTSKVSAADETAILIEVPGFDNEKAIGVIKAKDLDNRRYRVGNTARVEVTGVRQLKSGRTILELKPALRNTTESTVAIQPALPAIAQSTLLTTTQPTLLTMPKPELPRTTRITRWKISNFRSVLESIDLSLAPLTIFCGPNSSGKSALIKSILTVAQSLDLSASQEVIALNGRFVSLGHLEDVFHHISEHSRMEIGFTLNLAPSDKVTINVQIEGQKSQLSKAIGRLDARISRYELSIEKSDGEQERILLIYRPIKSIEPSVDLDKANRNLRGQIEKGMFNYEVVEPKYTDLSPEPIIAEGISASLSNLLPGNILFRVRSDVRDITQAIRQLTNALQIRILEAGEITIESDQELSQAAKSLFSVVSRQLERQESRPDPDIYLEIINEIAQSRNPLTIRGCIDIITGFGRTRSLTPDEIVDLTRRLSGALADSQKDPLNRERTELEVGLIPAKYARIIDRVRQGLSDRIFYLGPLRDDPRVIYAIPSLLNQHDVGLKGEYTAAMLELFGENEEVEYPLPPESEFKGYYEIKNGKLIEAVQVWLQRMGLAENVEATETSKVGYRLNVRTEGLTAELDLTSVGVGVSQILPTIVMALLAPKDSVLIFEQPEVHLHPKVQSVLGDFFLGVIACGKQCIVETHSEHLINRIRRRIAEARDTRILDQLHIYFVERDDSVSRFSPVEPNEFGAILRWPKGFFDEVEEESSLIMHAALTKRQERRGH